MKRTLMAVLIAALMIPSAGFANDWRHGRGHGHPRTVVVRDRHHYDGAAIAAGVLGGIVTGVILDRVFTPPPAPPQPVYYPPPPAPRAPRDPYDDGYSDGYSRGVERGRYERYEQGKRRGYEEGYEDARSGRGW
jgi:hypothetical protein